MKGKGNLKRQIEARLRLVCQRLSEKQRKEVVLSAFVLFAAGCLYVVISSFIGLGGNDDHLEINHITPLNLKEESR